MHRRRFWTRCLSDWAKKYLQTKRRYLQLLHGMLKSFKMDLCYDVSVHCRRSWEEQQRSNECIWINHHKVNPEALVHDFQAQLDWYHQSSTFNHQSKLLFLAKSANKSSWSSSSSSKMRQIIVIFIVIIQSAWVTNLVWPNPVGSCPSSPWAWTAPSGTPSGDQTAAAFPSPVEWLWF